MRAKSKVSESIASKTNRLFRPGPDTDLNACVGYNGGLADYCRQGMGYFEAGNRILVSLRENSFLVDALVYPLVFNFRQGIELYLKHFILKASPLCDQPPQVKHSHKLADLWTTTRALLTDLADDADFDEESKEVDQAIADFVEVDPRGTVFRYPTDTDGVPHLTEWYLINVKVLGEAMATVYRKFEAWDAWVSSMADWQEEMESYRGQDGHH